MLSRKNQSKDNWIGLFHAATQLDLERDIFIKNAFQLHIPTHVLGTLKFLLKVH